MKIIKSFKCPACMHVQNLENKIEILHKNLSQLIKLNYCEWKSISSLVLKQYPTVNNFTKD